MKYLKRFENNDGIAGTHTDVENGYPIVWDNRSDELNIGGYGTTHFDNDIKYNSDFDYHGRIWHEEKLMAFWYYPSREDFKIIIGEIELISKKKIWDNGYRIEVILNDSGEQMYSDASDYLHYELIPIEDYDKSLDAPEEEISLHLMDPKEKELYYKKQGKPSGWGSDLKMEKNPIEWEQAKRTSENIKSWQSFNSI